MSAIKYTLLVLLTLIACMAFGQDVEVEELELDARTTLTVCAAAFIVAEDPTGATWYSTIADDEEAVVFFIELFVAGLEAEEITSDDVADTIEACIKIKAIVDSKEPQGRIASPRPTPAPSHSR